MPTGLVGVAFVAETLGAGVGGLGSLVGIRSEVRSAVEKRRVGGGRRRRGGRGERVRRRERRSILRGCGGLIGAGWMREGRVMGLIEWREVEVRTEGASLVWDFPFFLFYI